VAARPSAPGWLVERPIAHRGLHDRANGRIENSLSAAAAAMAQGFAIECDVQITSDGEAVVFHDFTLDRLTAGQGRVDAAPARRVTDLALAATDDRIATLADFLAAIGGRTPLICEIKSRFDGDFRLAGRVAEIVDRYEGPAALKSFDPAVIAHLRARGTRCPLGIVAEAHYDDPEWAELSVAQRFALANALHYRETQPDFLSYAVTDLPHAVPFLCRNGIGMPVMTWTVRTPEQRAIAAEHADQIVFEGFLP
jgi:glycerophosphoryl diester phosphodiesterase